MRLATAAVAVPLLLLVAWVDVPYIYGLTVLVGALLGALESRSMLRAGGHQPFELVLFGTALLLPFNALFLHDYAVASGWRIDSTLALMGLLVITSLVLPILRPRLDGSISGWSLSLSLGLYISLLGFFGPLRDRPEGSFWVIATFLMVWACDTAAYFVGRSFGKRKLLERISPGKTVEGTLGGIAVAVLAGGLLGVIVGKPILLMAGFGLAIAIAAIYGDLAESFLKRQTGVKDSGVIMPGHGGILDRMDSLLFGVPMAVLFVTLFT